MTAAADPFGALRTILLADSDVDTACGGRVFCFAVPKAEVKAMPRAAVLLKPAAGPRARSYQELTRQRVTVDCIGDTLDVAWDLWLTVKPVLNQVERVTAANALIHSATMEAEGVNGVDPFTQWPTTFSSWIVLASDIAIP